MSRLNSRIAWRPWWLKIHRWLGLFLLVLSIPIGLTGSLNVYQHEIDGWLHPEFYQRRSQGGTPLPLAEILRRARAADSAPVVSMILPAPYWSTIWVHQRQPDKRVTRTAIDPISGEIQGRRIQAEALTSVIYRLHQNLLLRDYWGEELVGICGLALALSSLSGIWLWWPKPGKFWRAITMRSGQPLYRTSWELHNALGFWTSVVLLLVALSGVYMIFPQAVRRVLWMVTTTERFRATPVKPQAGPPCSDPDRILEFARAYAPEKIPMVLILPNPKLNTWRVAMRESGSHATSGGSTQLWIDPWRMSVHQERSDAKLLPGDQLLALQFSIHNGSIAGDGGRFLVFLSGLAFPILGISGVYLWWHKRRLQQRAELAKKARKQNLD